MSNRLQQAYDKAKHWLREELPEAEAEAAKSLSAMMKSARSYLVAAEQLSADEAHKVIEGLRSDVHDWAQDLQQGSAELADWARFDLQQLEQAIAERLLAAADPTWVQLEQFQRGREELSSEGPGPRA